ncbi:DapH/DapD/GlmU-related protein [Tellurirhabdus rosea]|uniref:DapH/DapD/GlmU-related protein n=1 Tax=Tellurirhabdus rosea TaxID=2674997 RepID=UPI002256EE5B|nr:DapH/DapD/GlmU-related protein [Tellurirhabdus rosea]
MLTIKDILDKTPHLQFAGNPGSAVEKVEELRHFSGSPTSLLWCNSKNLPRLKTVEAGIIICPKGVLDLGLNPACHYIMVENPRQAFQQVVATFFAPPRKTGICSTAAIDPSARIGKNVFIGHQVVIEENVVIGDNTFIGHHTVISAGTVIENDVYIGANNTIGGIGFGYEKDENGQYARIPHIGNVVIRQKVEIDNNTCIDRAVIGSTIIEENVKIGNLVHISHGVVIGRNSLVIANSMLGGSITLGENVWVAPSANILNGLEIGANSLIGMGAVVTKNVEEKSVMAGNPARSIRKMA